MREAGRASIFPLLGEGVFVVRVDCIVLNTPGSPTPQRNNSLHLLYMSHYAHTGCRSTDSQTEGQQELLHGFRIRLLSVPDTLYVFVTDSRKQTKAARIDKGVLVALQPRICLSISSLKPPCSQISPLWESTQYVHRGRGVWGQSLLKQRWILTYCVLKTLVLLNQEDILVDINSLCHSGYYLCLSCGATVWIIWGLWKI